MAVPYTFGTATAAIPLSQLDSNFATAITLGNTAVYLGNTTTSIGNLTLTNVTISSGEVTTGNVSVSGNVTLSGGTANGVAYLNGSKVLTTGSALTYDGTNLTVNTGTVSATYGKLTVAGGISITPDSSSKLQIGRYSVGAPYSYIKMGSTSSGLKFTDPADSVDLAVLDSAGNLGLGVTPSAWSGVKALEIASAGSGIYSFGATDVRVTGNAYWNGSAYKYGNTNLASMYVQNAGIHYWYVAPSGTAGNAISFTQAMTLDASGRLIIGNTTMPVGYGTALNVYTTGVGARVYGTTESAGPFWVDKQTNTSSTSQVFVQFTINTQATGNGQINGNGASQVAFGSFSDRRLKENITDLPPQLANIMALRPVEFDYIESEGGGHQTSFIAQEFEEIYPDAIGERADGMKTLTGWGKTEARLVKAIQEQQAIIQLLTARITALESA